MERKPTPSPSLHALDITSYSSPIHSLDSPLGVLSKTLSSKHLFGRRIRSNHKISSGTSTSNVAAVVSNVPSLPPRTEPTPIITDSPSSVALEPLNQAEFEQSLQPSTTTTSISSTKATKTSKVRAVCSIPTSRVSLVTSTFRKFRARRAEHSQVENETVFHQTDPTRALDIMLMAPSLPKLLAISPFPQPTLFTARSMSTTSLLAAPGYPLRSTYSDSSMNLRSRPEPIAPFTRYQGSFGTTPSEGAVVYPRSASSRFPKKRPTETRQNCGGQGGLGIVGMFYCTTEGKYSVTGGLDIEKPVAAKEVAILAEDGETDATEHKEEAEEEQEEGIMIDAGIMILREAKAKPAASPREIVKRVPLPSSELALGDDNTSSMLLPGPNLVIVSQPMVREKHAGSTETAASLDSGTDAGGDSGASRQGSESGGWHALGGAGLGEAASLLGIFFPEGEEGKNGLPSPLPEASSPMLHATTASQRVFSLKNREPGVASAFLQSPLLLGLGHPTPRLAHSPAQNAFSKGKRSQSLVGLFCRSSSGSASPSASSNGSPIGVRKSVTGLGMLGKRGRRGRREQGDVLSDYAQVAYLLELKDGE